MGNWHLHLMRACLDLLVKNGEFRPLWPKEPEAEETSKKPKPPMIYTTWPATKPVKPIPVGIPPLASTAGPGCTAADETLVVKGHLEGIVHGHWGTGVLQHDIVRLDRAIAGAKAMGDASTMETLIAIKGDLPMVRDPQRATAVLEKVEAVVPAVGALAQRCGGKAEDGTLPSEEEARKEASVLRQLRWLKEHPNDPALSEYGMRYLKVLDPEAVAPVAASAPYSTDHTRGLSQWLTEQGMERFGSQKPVGASGAVLTADSDQRSLLRARVAELAEKVKKGEITKEQAVAQVQEEMSEGHKHDDAGHT